MVTELKIVSGDPALDLVNTVGDDRVPDPLDHYESFADWAARAGVIDETTASRLAARGRDHPARAEGALAEARNLRAVMDAVFRPLATAPGGPPVTAGRSAASGSGRPAASGRGRSAASGRERSAASGGAAPSQEALTRLVVLAGAAIERGRLEAADGGLRLVWGGDHLERPLWPLAAAAVDLLRSGPLDRLKACEGCPWLFLDTSRNGSRRWCSMDDCGSRSKMRRYRARRATGGR